MPNFPTIYAMENTVSENTNTGWGKPYGGNTHAEVGVVVVAVWSGTLNQKQLQIE